MDNELFTYEDCEQVQAILDLLDGAQRTNSPYVQLRAEDILLAEQTLQRVLDKMLIVGG